MTDPAANAQQPQPGEPALTERTFLYSFSGQPESPGTWTADAAYPADSPVTYTLTAQAETLLAQDGCPTPPLPNGHPRGMAPRPPHARPGPTGPSDGYVTEISVPTFDSGIQRLHARMKEPEPQPEAGL
jgi:hypothetical protein